jgi:hypothetical protein
MTQQEQDVLIRNYQEQLSQLDSAYVAERFQQLIMKNKQDNRKQCLVKVHQQKQELTI